MSIFLPKNAQHKLEAQQKAEENRYRNMMSGLSDELIEWLKEKNLTIAEFETLYELTRKRFQITFGKKKIKDL